MDRSPSKRADVTKRILYVAAALAIMWFVVFSDVLRQTFTPHAGNPVPTQEELFHRIDDCHVSVSPSAVSLPVQRKLPPSLPLCTVLSYEMLDAPELKPWFIAMNMTNRRIRKQFELTHLLWTLDKMGAMTPQAEGLAVAAGHEITMYYLSSRVKMMYAGDMYGDTGFAADGTSAAEISKDPGKFAPPGLPWDPSRLKVMWQDARNLSAFKNGSLDFVYSLSSLEHVGGDHAVKGAAQSIREQARIVKEGGIVYAAVDLLVTGHGEMPGNGFNVSQMYDAIIKPAEQSGLKLVEPVHWGITPLTLETAIFVGVYGVKIECSGTAPEGMHCLKHADWYPGFAKNPRKYRCGTSLIMVFRKKL